MLENILWAFYFFTFALGVILTVGGAAWILYFLFKKFIAKKNK